MDVPYNKSGASSRAHYQIVRNIENAPHRSEQLIRQEVDRIRERITGNLLSTSELRKYLIVLLYCLNSSFGAVNSKTLAFALPFAVHLAEAGPRVSEKRIGYLFCWEVMPREHELQLMLVNTIRKDLTSSSVAKINLALESLVNLPSADVVPAVQTRCVELLSYPSPRIRVLSMKALQSLVQYVPDLLNDENVRQLVSKRLEDGDECVVRTALKLGLSLIESNIIESEKIMRPSISFVIRMSDRQSMRNYSTAFAVSILSIISKLCAREEYKAKLDIANELLPSALVILQRAVKHDQKSLLLECFRLLRRFPPSTVAEYIVKASSHLTTSPQQREVFDKPRLQFIHPVARIRHFLSSRTVNDHYLFLSCLVCVDPCLWAGTSQASEDLLPPDGVRQEAQGETESSVAKTTGILPVLDQLEVERVLSFLESEDEQIRALTLRILIRLEPSLVEVCYTRALEALRASDSSSQASHPVQRSVELVGTLSLGNEKLRMENRGRMFVLKLREMTEAAGAGTKVNGMIVEAVLSRIRKEQTLIQRSCIINLLSLLQGDDIQQQKDASPLSETLFLILLALTCELASIFESSKNEVVSMICLFASVLHVSPVSMQEPLLLCMMRLVALLSPVELSSSQIEDVRRVIHEFDEKRGSVVARCGQFEKALSDPEDVRCLLGNKKDVSLPGLALLLDQADRRSFLRSNTISNPSSPPTKPSSLPISQFRSPLLSQSKLRYDAYAPPPPPTASSVRLFRARSHSSTASVRSRNTNRPSSRASSSRHEEDDVDAELSRTVTAGELTLAAGPQSEIAKMYKSGKGKSRVHEIEYEMSNLKLSNAPPKSSSELLPVDSPFLPEPLVDVQDSVNLIPTTHTPPASTSPYVSASTSLRTSPEPGPRFEVLWSEMNAFSARGWCEDAVDAVVRKLQGLGLKMDVLDVDVPPFEGELKISLSSLGASTPSVLLRLHEEEDNSFLWQVRSSDREVGLKVKEFMN